MKAKKHIFAITLLVGVLSVLFVFGSDFAVWADDNIDGANGNSTGDSYQSACSADANLHPIKWQMDATYHWGICECKKIVAAKEKHSLEEKIVLAPGVNQDGKKLVYCTICGYGRDNIVTIPGSTTQASEEPKPPILTNAPTSSTEVKKETTTAATTAATTEATKPVNNTKPVEASTSNGVVPSVTTNDKGEATLTDIKATSKKTVKVDKVEVNGVKYDVTVIDADAFKNCSKVKTIDLPATVKTINKSAFAGCDSLKTIKINTKKSITVKNGAFKGLDTKKMTIKVNKKMPAKQLKKFKAVLKKAGFKGKIKK